MTPAERAAQVHGQFGLFRAQRDAVQRHARALTDTHTLTLPGPAPADGAPAGERSALEVESPSALEVESPSALSDQLLKALFGRWPPAGT